jgi:hypothetical protein
VTVPSISRSTKVCFSQASASAVLIGTQQAAAAAAKTPVNQWTIEELCAFFAAQKLDVHIAAIKQNGVDGGMLLDLIAEDALGELGIKSTVHKLRIKRGLEASTDDRPKVAGAQAVVRCVHRCGAPAWPHAYAPRCRAAHVRLVQVQAQLRPHVVPCGE